MSNKIGIDELNPRPSKFMLAGEAYELKKFSLAAQVWANDEFKVEGNDNGLAVLAARIERLDPSAIAQTCYYLLKDKSSFPVVGNFIDAMGDHNNVLSILLKPLSDCLGVSQPTVDETAEEVELKK